MALWLALLVRLARLMCRSAGVFAFLLLLSFQGAAQSVVFINPGRSDETFWRNAAEAMEGAARSLHMTLEVRYAERNPLQAIAIARDVAARAERPRFVVFVNENSVAPEILKALEAAGIDSFVAFSGIQQIQRAQVGQPREKFKHWLGSLEPRAVDAGYMTAKALIETARASRVAQAQDGRLQLLAIGGDRSTLSSMARNAGMRKAVAEDADVILVQEVNGEWRRDKAAEQMRVLAQRYPEARLVWTGNDEMALGAMQAWRARGGTPGRDGFFSTVNTSPAAFAALRSGELSVLAGGHFMAGAWALVMLYDYAHGKDFRSEGLELERRMFVLFDPPLIDRFEQRFGASGKPLDFGKFSKVLNAGVKHYRFEIEALLR